MSKPHMKIYSGKRTKDNICIVHVIGADGDSKLLEPRLDLSSHSPTGFEWGYGGSGPAQLALAILADCFEQNPELAVRMHQKFKWKFISGLERSQSWTISEQEVIRFVTDQLKIAVTDEPKFPDAY